MRLMTAHGENEQNRCADLFTFVMYVYVSDFHFGTEWNFYVLSFTLYLFTSLTPSHIILVNFYIAIVFKKKTHTQTYTERRKKNGYNFFQIVAFKWVLFHWVSSNKCFINSLKLNKWYKSFRTVLIILTWLNVLISILLFEIINCI